MLKMMFLFVIVRMEHYNYDNALHLAFRYGNCTNNY